MNLPNILQQSNYCIGELNMEEFRIDLKQYVYVKKIWFNSIIQVKKLCELVNSIKYVLNPLKVSSLTKLQHAIHEASLFGPYYTETDSMNTDHPR